MKYIPGPVAMEPMPIDEALIVSGNPVATAATLHTTADGSSMVGLFHCTPGKFHFTLESPELTHLLSGHILIQPEDGELIEATAGDTYVFPAGTNMLIDIRETITDIFVTWSA